MANKVPVNKTSLLRSICRESLTEFVREFWHLIPGAGDKLVWNWHIDLFCDELQVMAERVFKGIKKEYDLVLNVSPGTSKSSIFSILFPAWVWTRMPSARFITASHTEELVLDLANKAREVIRSELYQSCFPEVQLDPKQDAKGYYTNTSGGDRKTCTVAGKSPIGFHGHFLITDDAIDPAKVLSEAELVTARNFITNVLPSRKVDKMVAVTMLVMQRLGLNDPTDVMLKEALKDGADPVRHVCLPSELDVGTDGAYLDANVSPKELATRYIDGLMDPVRLNRESLAPYKARGLHYYSTQFLQKPYAQEGEMFKREWFNNRIRAAPYNAKRIRFWDRACLVGETLVETINGAKRIDEIKAGEMVLTRKGYRKVVWSGMTKIVDELISVRFDNGFSITGTADHRIWTENRGWISLALLLPTDRCVTLCISAETSIIAKDMIIKYSDDERVRVYDLEVEDAHEFFANGILVHNSTADGGCYTAGVLMAKDHQNCYYIEHVVHGQWGPDERNRIMRSVALRDRARYSPKNEPIIHVEREGGSSGRDAWLGVVRALAGFVVKEHTVSGSKDTRAEPWASQLAGGNVFIVDNGESESIARADWDIDSYVEEHKRFKPEPGKRLGKFKDQVDSSSAAFTILSGLKQAGTVRVLSFKDQSKKGQLKIVVCSKDELANTIMDKAAVLISLRDPLPPMEMETPNDPPAHGLTHLLEMLDLYFVDINPEDYQERWQDVLAPWNKTVTELKLNMEQGKKLWAFLLKKRQINPIAIVIHDDGDRRALSVGLAICDVLRQPREVTVYKSGEPDWKADKKDKPPNTYVYDVVKGARGLVVS